MKIRCRCHTWETVNGIEKLENIVNTFDFLVSAQNHPGEKNVRNECDVFGSTGKGYRIVIL